jgi:formamidopyrimidine-DNA glycosylase
MPELPEVETTVRRFRPLLQGRRVIAFRTRWQRHAVPSVPAVRRGVVGRTIARVSRRGKYIVLVLDDGGHLLIHLRMSGRLEWAADHEQEPPHVRTLWEFEGGHRLLFCDARKFGRVVYTRNLATTTAGLGIEPLAREFTADALAALLRRRARQLKPLLLDQSVVAGLGNIYVDEALFRARLHPLTPSDHLSAAQAASLHEHIRALLREAIRHHGTTFDWVYPSGGMQTRLRVYGRTGEPCPVCHTPIEYLRVGQRGTHICPRCQPANGDPRRKPSQ